MTVKELIQKLEDCDPNRLVVLAHDAEGNGFTMASEVDGDSVFEEEQHGTGWCTSPEDGHDGAPCVVLWPV